MNVFVRFLQRAYKKNSKWAWWKNLISLLDCKSNKRDDIFINQSKYIKNLLKRFRIEHVKEVDTPMGTSSKLDMDEDGDNLNITKYRGMIDSLLYLIASKPDIMFLCLSMCMFSNMSYRIPCNCCKTHFLLHAWYNWFRVVVSKSKRVEFN